MTSGHFFWVFALFCAGVVTALWPVSSAPAIQRALRAASLWQTVAFCLALVGLFLMELRVVDVAATTQRPFPLWFAQLPILPIDDNPPLLGHTPPWVGNALLILTVFQAFALWGLYATLRRRVGRKPDLAILALAALAMLGAGLATRGTLSTDDLYLNVGYGHLGLRAYAPPAAPFTGELRTVNRVVGAPLLGAIYGPLWLGVASTVVKTGATLGAQLQAFRILGAVALVLCIPLLRRLGLQTAEIALVALNPAILIAYVVDAHNDIVPLGLSLLAMVTVGWSPWLALVSATAAGTMKLPLALAASLAFCRLDDRRLRLSFALATIALSLCITLVASHGAYIADAKVAIAYQSPPGALFSAAHALALGAAGTTVFLALWSRRYIATGAWTFLALGATVLPWYALWGLPYAILQRTFLPVFLITLPLLGLDLSTSFGLTPAMRLLYLLVICTPILFVLRERGGYPGLGTSLPGASGVSGPKFRAR
ncbi:MAG TPA: hypothetical protein VKG44_04820 [Candidatus Baltobacteraceae bacterium]|nr:hypothetical protein [Candidatus Baltobacteraceae bacterium]